MAQVSVLPHNRPVVLNLRVSIFFFLVSANLFLLGVINPMSGFSLFFFLLLTLLLVRLLREDMLTAASLFLAYALLAMLVYLAQLASFGGPFGFSGIAGFNADDSYYYVMAAPDLPADFPPMRNYNLNVVPAFSQVLRIFSRPIYALTGQIHLLDLLFLNILVLTLTPFFTALTAQKLMQDQVIKRAAFRFTAICPVLLSHGIVLYRDSWAALLIIAALFFFLQRQFIWLVLASGLLFFLRPDAGALLLMIIILYAFFSRENTNPPGKFFVIYLTVMFTLVSMVIIYPALREMVSTKGFGGNFLFRQGFFDTWISREAVQSTGDISPFYFLGQQPFFIRIPGNLLFFLFLPYFSWRLMFLFGSLLRPAQIVLSLYAILFILFYSRYLCNSIVSALTQRKHLILLTMLVFFMCLLILSQASLQPRHKTWIMPLFYLIIAYGYRYQTSTGTISGIFLGVSLFLLQLIINVLELT